MEEEGDNQPFGDATAIDVKSCQHTDPSKWRLLCVTCIEYICFKCAFHNHKKHVVVSKENLQEELQKGRESIKTNLAETKGNIYLLESSKDRATPTTSQKHQDVAKYFEDAREGISMQRNTAEEKLHKLNRSIAKTSEGIEHELHQYSNALEHINLALVTGNHGSIFNYLQRLNRYKKQLDDFLERIKTSETLMKAQSSSIRFCPYSLSCNFVEVTFGPIAGAVRINDQEIVFVFDERHGSRYVIRLSCFPIANTSSPTWSHVIDPDIAVNVTDVARPPVVVCNKLPKLDDQCHLFIGCGPQIYTVTVGGRKSNCYFVSVSSKSPTSVANSVLRSLDWGTSDHMPSRSGLFATESASTSIMRLDGNMSVTERIDCGEICKNAIGFGKEDSMHYAFVTAKEVKVGDESGKPYRILESPDTDVKFYPRDLLFDGAVYSVLWVSDSVESTESTYKVTTYNLNGSKRATVYEGDCSPGIKAVGLSHIKNNANVILSNGDVICYNTL